MVKVMLKCMYGPVSSIYIWSENVSYSDYEKSDAKMAEIDVQ